MNKSNKNPPESAELDLISIVKTWPDRLKQTGVRQEDAAAESGISTGLLSHYLNGINLPTIGKFQDFENWLRGRGV